MTLVQAAKKLKRLPAVEGAAAQPSLKKPKKASPQEETKKKKRANSAEPKAARPGQKILKG
jgi:hypothetical protein